jgi:hypothetical protein
MIEGHQAHRSPTEGLSAVMPPGGHVKESSADAQGTLVDMAIEGWRLARLFSRALTKMDAGEGSRYANQLRYYLKRLEESLESAGLRIVNLEGQPYDSGMAATALNISDFAPDDRLLVDQMLEPIIMNEAGLFRSGTVMLRKIEL